jgi:hypothetical protein
VVRRIGLASKAVHEWSGDFSRRAFKRCAAHARVSVHRSATRVELPFVASTCVWCAQLVHILVTKICGQAGCGSPGSRVCLLHATRLSRVVSSTCRSGAQDTHRLVNKNCGQPWAVSASEKRVRATRHRCIECNLSCVNDLRRSCSGYSQACHQKLWTRTQARARQKPSINECERSRMHYTHSEPHQ